MANDATDAERIVAAIAAVSERYEADVLVYVGYLFDPDDDRVLKLCRKRTGRRRNIVLILSTPGGSADAAYRIARCL